MLKRIKFPDPLILMAYCIVIATVATYFVPAGQYEREKDEFSGQELTVPGSYQQIPASPVGFFDMLVAVPKGMQEAASVIFFVFLVGGAFMIINETGALNAFVNVVANRLGNHTMLAIPGSIVLFSTMGAIQGFQEEIIPLVPVLALLCRRLGFNNITGAAISIGAAVVGAAFSPMNPFQVGIAQKIAGVELLSGGIYRSIVLVVAVITYILIIYFYSQRTRTKIEQSERNASFRISSSHKTILALVLASFVLLVIGIAYWDWDFEQMAAVFVLAGIASGLIGRLGGKGTVAAFVKGFRDMAYAGLLIGFARAIFVVLEDGLIVDSLVNGLFSPISSLPDSVSLTAITLVQSIIHFPVPSISSQAILTIPVLAPLADLMGVSRQIIILCYQYGGGLAELIIPTNGGIIAILAGFNLTYSQWVKFSFKVYLILLSLGLVAIYIAQFLDL